MQKFWKIAPWIARLLLVPPTLVFTMIAARYLTEPVRAAAEVGLNFTSPLGLTILRIGFGAFPLGCGIVTLACLLSARRVLLGLSFVATMMSTILIVRVAGMLADGTVSQSLGLVRAEIIMLILMSAGILLETGRMRRLNRVPAQISGYRAQADQLSNGEAEEVT